MFGLSYADMSLVCADLFFTKENLIVVFKKVLNCGFLLCAVHSLFGARIDLLPRETCHTSRYQTRKSAARDQGVYLNPQISKIVRNQVF